MPLKSIFDLRFLPITGGVVLLALFGLLAWAWPEGRWVFVGLGGLCCIVVAIGLRDLTQTRHAILRNYPVTAHLRFLLEHIRPEMRQYFFEGEKDGTPFARDKRALVYQRAKQALDKRPFGTQYNVYEEQYEWLHHSIMPKPTAPLDQMRVLIGRDTKQPYSASLLNISAMSFGALSANAVLALNKGAKLGGFFMTRAKVACHPITAPLAAIWCGRLDQVISARAAKMGALMPPCSPPHHKTRRSKCWNSSSAKEQNPVMAAFCQRPR